jgi:hypothetical protein
MDKQNMQTTNIVDENIKRIGGQLPDGAVERGREAWGGN